MSTSLPKVRDGSSAAAVTAESSGFSKPSLRTFFLSLAGVATLIIGAVWVWAAEGRMHFFNPEYPMWLAKYRMVDECTYGDTVIIGDSRAMAGLIPDQIGGSATNLALPGGTSIESYYLMRRMDRCQAYPKRVILSFLPLFMTRVHMYWLRPALYNMMSFEEMEEVRRLSLQLNDPIIYSTNRFGTVLDSIKNYSYRVSLPSYYFSAMVSGRFVERFSRNKTELALTLKDHGHHYFGMAPRAPAISEDGYMKAFEPSPVLNWYMEELLRKLDERDVEIDFVGTPVNPATFGILPQPVVASFKDYLAAIEQRYEHFHIVGDIIRVLPDDDFGDLEHLNPKGAEAWTGTVRTLLDSFAAASGQ